MKKIAILIFIIIITLVLGFGYYMKTSNFFICPRGYHKTIKNITGYRIEFCEDKENIKSGDLYSYDIEDASTYIHSIYDKNYITYSESYNKGYLHKECSIKNGNLTCTTYKSNGFKTLTESKDKNGLLNGPYILYYTDGTPYYKGDFEKDKKTGLRETLDTKGNIISKINYNIPHNNSSESENMKQNENMKQREDIKQSEDIKERGNKDGPSIYYYKDGQVYINGGYIDNYAIGLRTRYDKNGNIIDEFNYSIFQNLNCSTGNKEDHEYYENGRLHIQFCKNKNDKKNGDYIEYYPNGEVKEKGNYKKDKKYGLFTEYLTGGVIFSKKNYSNDIIKSETIYHTNGEKRRRTTYKEGNIETITDYDFYGNRINK